MVEYTVLQRAKDYAYIFGTEQGQRVLEDLDKSCYTNRSTFSDNPQVMANREGRREVVLQIRWIIELLKSGKLEQVDGEKYFDSLIDDQTT